MFSSSPPLAGIPECFNEAPPVQQFALRQEARSYFNTKCLYAAKGSTVTLVKDAGNVSIVERADGERFPVATENLKPIAAGRRQIS